MNEENLNKTLQCIYLSASGGKDAYTEAVILKLLFDHQDFLAVDDIAHSIQDEYDIKLGLEYITYVLDNLVLSSRCKKDRHSRFKITDAESKVVFSIQQELKQFGEVRKTKFYSQFSDILANLEEAQHGVIWDLFNKYLFECFLQEGRAAAESFLPYHKPSLITSGRKEIYSELTNTLSPDLKLILQEIINLYPSTVDNQELKFLSGIADKTELFYSLGVPEYLREEAASFMPDNMIVLCDTNVLFSVLGLSTNPEDSAIRQLLEVVSSLDSVALKYLPITKFELRQVKNELQKVEQVTKFTSNQLTVLLESDDLDPYMRKYFADLLEGNDPLHPSYIIQDSDNVLLSRGLPLHNVKMDFYDDDKYIEKLKADYFQYESMINPLRLERGLNPKNKTDSQVDHDIKLRQTILHLRHASGDRTIVGLSLDRHLVRFDRYDRTKSGKHRTSNHPAFLSPTQMLRRLKSFLPVVTTDYNRAFITSLTALPVKTSDFKVSKELVRTIKRFHALGINDISAIRSIVQNEILFTELNAIEDDRQAELFIQGQIDKHMESLNKSQQDLHEKLKTKEDEAKGLSDKVFSLRKSVELANQNSEQFRRELDLLNERNRSAESESARLKQQKEKDDQRNLGRRIIFENNAVKQWRLKLYLLAASCIFIALISIAFGSTLFIYPILENSYGEKLPNSVYWGLPSLFFGSAIYLVVRAHFIESAEKHIRAIAKDQFESK